MRLLLTNDDGIGAEGLRVLAAALAPLHEVWVCAPDTERSGSSHSIQLAQALRIRSEAPRWFSCSGSPADCVFLAVHGSFIPEIDAVVSGINHGPNLGTDIVYSGTCAAARQAVLLGIPALAVSLAAMRGGDFSPGASVVAEQCQRWLADLPAQHFWNINLPARPELPWRMQQVRPCVRRYEDVLTETPTEDGALVCQIEGHLGIPHQPEGTDWQCVEQGQIAMSAIPAQPAFYPTTGGPR